jgi:hypothetical protein
MPGTAIYLNTNHCMNDDCVTSYATRLYNATTRGTKIYVQFSNEILFGNDQNGWLNPVASITGLTVEQAAMQRTAEMQDIFESVWGADSGSIVRVYQTPGPNPSSLQIALEYAQTNKIRVDKIATGFYPDMDFSPTFKTAAVQICATDSRSIAYTAGLPVLPIAAYADLMRWHLKYSSKFNGPTGQNAAIVAAIIASGYGNGSGGFSYPQPASIGYKITFSTAIPGGVSLTYNVIRAGLTHDVMYHPSFYDVEQAFLQCMQQPGPAGSVGFESNCITGLNNTRSAGGNGVNTTFGPPPNTGDQYFCEEWQTYGYQSQVAGYGSGNLFWAGALGGGATGGDGSVDMAYDLQNVSVNGQSYNDWINAAAGNVLGAATFAPTEGHDALVAPALGNVTATLAALARADSPTMIGRGLAPAAIRVSPSRIQPNQSTPAIVITLAGTSTAWTSGSTVTVTNSITGTTTVTAGTWTRISATSATLAVTTSAGTGTWKITIDGIDSPILAVGSRRKGWTGNGRPRLRLTA